MAAWARARPRGAEALTAPLPPAARPLPSASSPASARTRPRRAAAPTPRAAAADQPPPPPPPAAEGADAAPGENGALGRADYAKFVRYMHLASPYVAGHRGRTFVVVLPGAVVADRAALAKLLEDVSLLHSLGARVVLVVGARHLIDEAQRAAGRAPTWVGAYRVTDEETLAAAVAAAGRVSTEVTALLSKAPSVPVVRRHARGAGAGAGRFAPAVPVVAGNLVTARRRGVAGGVDFGHMGQVRYVQAEAVRRQLEGGSVVLLTNVGVSAAGELLNCTVLDVAVHAAVELGADKLIVLTGAAERALGLPHYLPLADAEALIAAAAGGAAGGGSDSDSAAATAAGEATAAPWWGGGAVGGAGSSDEEAGRAAHGNGNGDGSGSGSSSTARAPPPEMLLDLDSWQAIAGVPDAVLAAAVACKRGVRRAHLVDAALDGGLLLELYTRDGIAGVCMIAADLYEGVRPATAADAPAAAALLALMEASGGPAPPLPPAALGEALERGALAATVVEREGRLLGLALVADLGAALDGERVAEVAAFVVDPGYRRLGFGDSLLDYVEQAARLAGFRRVVLVAGAAGAWDWAAQRGFEAAGGAAGSPLLPPARGAAAPPLAKLLAKPILELDASLEAPAGKRIGF
jgi:amino-acid N-acetyltransferase